jgi:transketolase
MLRSLSISLISWEEFEKQPESYRKTLVRGTEKLCVSVEAGCGLGWQKFVGDEGLIISQETFGASAPELFWQTILALRLKKCIVRLQTE